MYLVVSGRQTELTGTESGGSWGCGSDGRDDGPGRTRGRCSGDIEVCVCCSGDNLS